MKVYPWYTEYRKCPNPACKQIYFVGGKHIPGLGYCPDPTHILEEEPKLSAPGCEVK